MIKTKGEGPTGRRFIHSMVQRECPKKTKEVITDFRKMKMRHKGLRINEEEGAASFKFLGIHVCEDPGA